MDTRKRPVEPPLAKPSHSLKHPHIYPNPMKIYLRIAATGLALLTAGWAEEKTAPMAGQAHSWSLVYLPDLDWTEAEMERTVTLLERLKPGLVVSIAPCPFAEKIRKLNCKPTVLDQTQRAKLGVACGIPTVPLFPYQDTSTVHFPGQAENRFPALVWLSSQASDEKFYGPDADPDELNSLARMQVRKQLGERHGEVVFLIDPSVPTPPEMTWKLPWKDAKYEQAQSRVTGFACIRPDALQSAVPPIDGIAARVPVLHWIHSGAKGMEWEVLPTDSGPAIQRSTPASNKNPYVNNDQVIGWVVPPAAPLGVPLWMDEYIINNPALDCGDNVPQGAMQRRFGWTDYGVTRDKFELLHSGDNPVSKEKTSSANLPHGAVRSPDNLFSVTVGALGEKGYPVDGDDGVNVCVDDLRNDKTSILYFACLSCAWPSTATWFTDRYVITSGTTRHSEDEIDETNLEPLFDAQTLHLFDLQTGRSFVTTSIARPHDQSRPNAPTERIYFTQEPSSENELNWHTLWNAIEAGYHAKAQQAPVAAQEVAVLAKLPNDAGMQWTVHFIGQVISNGSECHARPLMVPRRITRHLPGVNSGDGTRNIT